MNRPVSYLQTDSRWKNHNYSAKGEKKTIGTSGCGPASAAMVIATLKDKNVTPVTTAEWSMAHGYKALNQGTFYTYFVPQLSAYGIPCRRLNTSSLYGKASSDSHTEALHALKKGDWVIACMGKGNWTNSGHFILLYGYENGYVYINDPASTRPSRTKNTWALFAGQVKYMWTVSASANPAYTKKQFIKEVQSSIGAKTDGIAGPETLSKTVTVSKEKNNRHAVVRPLQTYFNVSGYHCGSVDGIAGTKFDTAVKAYQKANGCISDGEITAKGNTWKSLLGLK